MKLNIRPRNNLMHESGNTNRELEDGKLLREENVILEIKSDSGRPILFIESSLLGIYH